MAGLISQAQQVRKAGRYGDSQLVHINPDEKAMLDRMVPMTTINPETGLPEYFLGGIKKFGRKIFKGAKNMVKGALEGDIMSIAGLALGVYTGGTALGAWGAGTVAAGGAGSIFSSGTFSGAMSALGTNMSNMATSAWNALSGGNAVAGSAMSAGQTVLANGVTVGAVPNAASLTTGAAGASGGGIGGMLSGMGSTIAKHSTAFSIAGQAAASMLEAQAAQDTADTSLEIAKNRARWDNEATAENYADSGYFGQDLGFKSPDYARQLMRPDGSNVYDRRGLVAHRLNQAGASNG